MRRIFVTRRREYHCVDELCLAVRDRITGTFVPHEATGRRVRMGVSLDGQGEVTEITPNRPDLGQRLCFSGEQGFVMTSPIVAVLDGSVGFFEEGAADPPLPLAGRS
jgi:hypothetical protein